MGINESGSEVSKERTVTGTQNNVWDGHGKQGESDHLTLFVPLTFRSKAGETQFPTQDLVCSFLF